MKKSIIDDAQTQTAKDTQSLALVPTAAPEKPSLFQELLFNEGGIILLVVLPAVVGFFLWSAMPPI